MSSDCSPWNGGRAGSGAVRLDKPSFFDPGNCPITSFNERVMTVNACCKGLVPGREYSVRDTSGMISTAQAWMCPVACDDVSRVS